MCLNSLSADKSEVRSWKFEEEDEDLAYSESASYRYSSLFSAVASLVITCSFTAIRSGIASPHELAFKPRSVATILAIGEQRLTVQSLFGSNITIQYKLSDDKKELSARITGTIAWGTGPASSLSYSLRPNQLRKPITADTTAKQLTLKHLRLHFVLTHPKLEMRCVSSNRKGVPDGIFVGGTRGQQNGLQFRWHLAGHWYRSGSNGLRVELIVWVKLLQGGNDGPASPFLFCVKFLDFTLGDRFRGEHGLVVSFIFISGDSTGAPFIPLSNTEDVNGSIQGSNQYKE
ncbi:hypothetical protein C8R43DRAFT_951578 [Mycena crocata]|nr:hypothetical protein C8R43DRAFT_951578 [Mycena crocata]